MGSSTATLMKVSCLVVVVMFIMVGAPLLGEAAINCGLVSQNLAPCIGFLENGQGPNAACCSGVKMINTLAATTQDRQTACRCMKSAATAFPGISPKNTAALPGKCGVNLPGSVGPQTDCSQVN